MPEPAKNRHLSMMYSPDDWPRWPALPLKRSRKNSFPEIGFILESKDQPYRVYLGSIYGESSLQDHSYMDYDSYEAIVEDGWIVD